MVIAPVYDLTTCLLNVLHTDVIQHQCSDVLLKRSSVESGSENGDREGESSEKKDETKKKLLSTSGGPVVRLSYVVVFAPATVAFYFVLAATVVR